MKHAYILLAEGFEEIEAFTPVDVLRRAGVQVHTVGVGGRTVVGGHDILTVADMDGEGFELPQEADMVILPGGGVGTANLAKSGMVERVLRQANERGLYMAAICAAPTVLHKYGYLRGRRATAFPDVQEQLTDSLVTGGAVEVDGRIITARSMGVALAFAHTLAVLLVGQAKADEVLHSLYPEAE